MTSDLVRPDAAQSEQLLSGSSDADSELARLLAAASAPARAEELAREDQAVRAFRAAPRTPPATPLVTTYPERRRPRWGWALVVKVAALALATASAGWALAASTGVVPAPWEEPPARPVPETAPVTPPVPHASPSRSTTSVTNTATPLDSPLSTGGEPGGSAGPSLDPTLRGLCQSFLSRGGSAEDLSTPGFARLVEAAGGTDAVPAYCTELLGFADPPRPAAPAPAPTPTPTVTPTPTAP